MGITNGIAIGTGLETFCSCIIRGTSGRLKGLWSLLATYLHLVIGILGSPQEENVFLYYEGTLEVVLVEA